MLQLLIMVAGLVLIFATEYDWLGISLLVLGTILVLFPLVLGLFAFRHVRKAQRDIFKDFGKF